MIISFVPFLAQTSYMQYVCHGTCLGLTRIIVLRTLFSLNFVSIKFLDLGKITKFNTHEIK